MTAEEQFVGEPLEPVSRSLSTRRMAIGAPGLPRRFRWRGREYRVAETLDAWKETGPCTSGGPERYVRKHWFRVRTEDGSVMKIYFERQARSGRQKRTRWWVYTVAPPTNGAEAGPADSS